MGVHVEKEMARDALLLLQEKYAGNRCEAYLQDLLRLQAGEPLDYVIGFTPFLGCHIDLTSQPLIPRSETEYWTEQVIESHKNKEQLSVLDIFAGSGCVGIAIAKHIPKSHVDFAELDWDHVVQIKKNLRLNNIPSSKATIFQSDSFERIPPKLYDVIVANPPYVAYERSAQVAAAVEKWEPNNSVFAADHGFVFIKILLGHGARFLKPKGVMYIEFDAPQHDAIADLVQSIGSYDAIFHKDQFGKWRYIQLINKGHVQ